MPVRKPAATVAGANWDSDSAEEGPQPAAPGKRPTAAAGGWDSDSEPEAAPRKPAKPAPKKAASGWDSDSEDDTPAEPKPKPKPKARPTSAGWDSDSQVASRRHVLGQPSFILLTPMVFFFKKKVQGLAAPDCLVGITPQEEQASPAKRAKGLAKQPHAEQGDPQSPTNATNRWTACAPFALWQWSSCFCHGCRKWSDFGLGVGTRCRSPWLLSDQRMFFLVIST